MCRFDTANPQAAPDEVADVFTQQEFDAAAEEVADQVRPWDAGGFTKVKKLQDAPMNLGRVDLMFSSEHGNSAVAVKQMPTRWVTCRPQDFQDRHPTASERPWFDLAVLRALNRRNCPFVCQLLGVFRDQERTYVVTSLATEGDLFGYCSRLPRPGPEREQALRPIMRQTFCGVQWLHEHGLAHGDLSLENIVLSDDGEGGLDVKLIDFAMGTMARVRSGKPRGKQVYLAPEVYRQPAYDPFRADTYALGVVVFAACAEDYPWATAKPNGCQSFQYCSTHGFKKFLEKRRAPSTAGRLKELFSRPLAALLEGLLQFRPMERLLLRDPDEVIAVPDDERPWLLAQAEKTTPGSVWEMPWLADEGSSLEATPTERSL